MDINFVSNNLINVLMNDMLTVLMEDNDTKGKWVMINYDPNSHCFTTLFQ